MGQQEVYEVLKKFKPEYLGIDEIKEMIDKMFNEEISRVSIYSSIKRMEEHGELLKKEVVINNNKVVKFVYSVKDERKKH
jgi:DNA-binding PadR family transcriptional regulator